MDELPEDAPTITSTERGTIVCFLGANKFEVQLRDGTVNAVMPDDLIAEILPYYQTPEKFPGAILRVTIRHRPKPAMAEIIAVNATRLSG